MAVKMMGAEVKRKEDPRLITGASTYTGDISLPGLHYVAFVRSPHAHARIRRIDGSRRAPAAGRRRGRDRRRPQAPLRARARRPGLDRRRRGPGGDRPEALPARDRARPARRRGGRGGHRHDRGARGRRRRRGHRRLGAAARGQRPPRGPEARRPPDPRRCAEQRRAREPHHRRRAGRRLRPGLQGSPPAHGQPAPLRGAARGPRDAGRARLDHGRAWWSGPRPRRPTPCGTASPPSSGSSRTRSA